jgi:hypothetical protein
VTNQGTGRDDREIHAGIEQHDQRQADAREIHLLQQVRVICTAAPLDDLEQPAENARAMQML